MKLKEEKKEEKRKGGKRTIVFWEYVQCNVWHKVNGLGMIDQ